MWYNTIRIRHIGGIKMPLPKKERYTYADLLSWDDGKRYELYDGKVVAMSSPSDVHQEILSALHYQLYDFLRGKPCTVYPSPFDVRLFDTGDDQPEDSENVLQPDLMVVCDKSKVDRYGVHGAPDLVIEVLSPSTQERDWREKFAVYQKAGVREYWVVDPAGRFVAAHILRDGKYDAPIFYTPGARVPVSLWDGFSVDLSTVFPE